jgi:hypothetical protein
MPLRYAAARSDSIQLCRMALEARRVSLAEEGQSLISRAGTYVAALLILAVGFGIYARRDRKPPSLWVETSALTGRDLRVSHAELCPEVGCTTVTVRYACDEPCSLYDFRFVDSFDPSTFDDRPLPNSKLASPPYESGEIGVPVPATKAIGSNLLAIHREEFPLPTRATRTISYGLSSEQSRWLRVELQRGDEVHFEVSASDNADNSALGFGEFVYAGS